MRPFCYPLEQWDLVAVVAPGQPSMALGIQSRGGSAPFAPPPCPPAGQSSIAEAAATVGTAAKLPVRAIVRPQVIGDEAEDTANGEDGDGGAALAGRLGRLEAERAALVVQGGGGGIG